MVIFNVHGESVAVRGVSAGSKKDAEKRAAYEGLQYLLQPIQLRSQNAATVAARDVPKTKSGKGKRTKSAHPEETVEANRKKQKDKKSGL